MATALHAVCLLADQEVALSAQPLDVCIDCYSRYVAKSRGLNEEEADEDGTECMPLSSVNLSFGDAARLPCVAACKHT